MDPKIKTVRLDKTKFEVFSSFEEADAADRAYWLSRTPQERSEALELMRQSTYGYDAQSAPRIQKVIEVVKLHQDDPPDDRESLSKEKL